MVAWTVGMSLGPLMSGLRGTAGETISKMCIKTTKSSLSCFPDCFSSPQCSFDQDRTLRGLVQRPPRQVSCLEVLYLSSFNPRKTNNFDRPLSSFSCGGIEAPVGATLTGNVLVISTLICPRNVHAMQREQFPCFQGPWGSLRLMCNGVSRVYIIVAATMCLGVWVEEMQQQQHLFIIMELSATFCPVVTHHFFLLTIPH